MSYSFPEHQSPNRGPKKGLGFSFLMLLAFGALMLFRLGAPATDYPENSGGTTDQAGEPFEPIKDIAGSSTDSNPGIQQKSNDWGMEEVPVKQAAKNENSNSKIQNGGFEFEEVELKKMPNTNSGFDFSTKANPPNSTQKGDFGFEEVPTKPSKKDQ